MPEDFPQGWDCKPECLLRLLDRGARSVVWLDSDLILSGNLPAWIRRQPADVLVVAEDPHHLSVRGTRSRALALALSPGRELGFTVNTCVLRVTEMHRPLLEAWRELLDRDDYRQAQQDQHMLERPFHLASDQDVLGGLLGSENYRNAAVAVLRNGREIVHSGGLRFDRLQGHLARIFGRRPLGVHAIALKPWQVLPPRPSQRSFRWWLLRLGQEVSLYAEEARALRAATGSPCSWLDHRTRSGTLLLMISLGSSAVRGLLFAAVVAVATGLGWGGRKPRAKPEVTRVATVPS